LCWAAGLCGVGLGSVALCDYPLPYRGASATVLGAVPCSGCKTGSAAVVKSLKMSFSVQKSPEKSPQYMLTSRFVVAPDWKSGYRIRFKCVSIAFLSGQNDRVGIGNTARVVPVVAVVLKPALLIAIGFFTSYTHYGAIVRKLANSGPTECYLFKMKVFYSSRIVDF
jgi:hypothetical protein